MQQKSTSLYSQISGSNSEKKVKRKIHSPHLFTNEKGSIQRYNILRKFPHKMNKYFWKTATSAEDILTFFAHHWPVVHLIFMTVRKQLYIKIQCFVSCIQFMCLSSMLLCFGRTWYKKQNKNIYINKNFPTVSCAFYMKHEMISLMKTIYPVSYIIYIISVLN